MAELKHLINVVYPNVKEHLAETSAQGDRSENAGYREDINDGENSVKDRNRRCLPKLETDGTENYIKRTTDDGKYRRDKALFSCYKHRAKDNTAKCRNQKLDQKVKK